MESLEEYVNRLLANAEPEKRASAHRRGDGHPRAKLTAADIPEIRRLAQAGASPKDLASRFGVSDSAVHGVLARRTWCHIPDVPAAPAAGELPQEQE